MPAFMAGPRAGGISGGMMSGGGGGGLAGLFGGGMGAGAPGGSDIWARLAAMLGGGSGQAASNGPGASGPGTAITGKSKLSQHENLAAKVNDSFNSLRAFGESLRGADMTPLNNIPRNPAQVILPGNNQNPGIVNLQALMAAIAGGVR